MKLYIIGNGFDIAHGIQSKYDSFRDFLINNYPDYYSSIMFGYNYAKELWKDFENELPLCAIYIEENGLQMGKEMSEKLDYDSMDDMGIGIWLDEQYKFLNELPKYLRLWIESIDTSKKMFYKIDKESKFLTFNYTDTLERVYSINPNNIKHIHGYVRNKIEELVIGHCNRKIISDALKMKRENEKYFCDFAISTYNLILKYCNNILKKTDKIIEKNAEFFENLSDIDEVVVIGHSLGKVDFPYFNKVINSIGENTIWNVYYYESSDEKIFKEILCNLGIREENIIMLSTQEIKTYLE